MSKKTFECAEHVGAILITQVKDNQEQLRKQIQHGCTIQSTMSHYSEDITKEHGRIEQRNYEVFDCLPMLRKWKNEWPYIRQIIRVTRYREEVRKSDPSLTVSFYVSNHPLDAKEYAQYIREHWGIENKLHHIKDVAFREDDMTKHCNPYIYSSCIDFSLNILRSYDFKNIKETLYRNSLDFFSFYEKIKNIL